MGLDLCQSGHALGDSRSHHTVGHVRSGTDPTGAVIAVAAVHTAHIRSGGNSFSHELGEPLSSASAVSTSEHGRVTVVGVLIAVRCLPQADVHVDHGVTCLADRTPQLVTGRGDA